MNATMAESINYATQRAWKTLRSALSIVGLLFLMVVLVPAVEMKVATPVSDLSIVNVKRVGQELTWDVTVLKHRDCRSQTSWMIKGGNKMSRVDSWVAPLLPGIDIGVQTVVGPFIATIPQGMQDLPDLRLDATVTYDCGIRWTMPRVDLQEVKINAP